jgi:hypothetical protein
MGAGDLLAAVALVALAGLGDASLLRDSVVSSLQLNAQAGAEGSNNPVCNTIKNTWWPSRVAQQSNVTQLDQWCSTYNNDAAACNSMKNRSAYSGQPSEILNAACTMQGHKNLNWYDAVLQNGAELWLDANRMPCRLSACSPAASETRATA